MLRKTPLARKSKKKRVVDKTRTKQVYKPPAWFMEIKLGSHGNTPAQKRLWKLVSDTYRKEDFEKYGGKCVSCANRFDHWSEGQLAHYKAWSNCKSWFKYERKNLALSCGRCNQINDGFVAEAFKQELIRRHGNSVIDWIEQENLKYRGQKMETHELVAYAERICTLNS